jgi:hypothetical protein
MLQPPVPAMKKKATSTDAPFPEPAAPMLPRKLGANHADTATRPRKHHNNFKQSNDLREDRGIRQLKTSPKSKSARGGR